MVYDPRDRHSPYRSPEVVLAEARRMAADIRRRAEREAGDIRREAAEWAATTRLEAERYRDRVLAELAHARDQSAAEPTLRDQPVEPQRVERQAGVPDAEVIDLRSRVDARDAPAVIETSIDTKVHEVVRHAVRRTFSDDEPDAITGR